MAHETDQYRELAAASFRGWVLDGQMPDVPPVGLEESHYTHLARQAERMNDTLARDAAKVGQYVTLALNDEWPWPKKRRSFDHCLRRHCRAPAYADNDVWQFYRKLADVVREHAGAEALRLASAEDDRYEFRRRHGDPRADIKADAAEFFGELLCCGDDVPKWFSPDDFRQIRMIRSQWV